MASTDDRAAFEDVIVEWYDLEEAQEADAELDLVVQTAQGLVNAAGGSHARAAAEADTRAAESTPPTSDGSRDLAVFWGDVAASIRDVAPAGRGGRWTFRGVDSPAWSGWRGLSASAIRAQPVLVDAATRDAVVAWLDRCGEVEAADEFRAVRADVDTGAVTLPSDFLIDFRAGEG